jgi:hypothetical protein
MIAQAMTTAIATVPQGYGLFSPTIVKRTRFAREVLEGMISQFEM